VTVRSAVTAFARTLLRIFFRRIEVAGLAKFPEHGPAIVVLNHPNGLVDPAVLLCLSPRPVSFVAKAPLFDMPVIGFLTRAIDSIPVWRQQDEGAANEKTRETFAGSCALLRKGGVLGLFPEGTSHDDPRMKPLKTGAARIALAAASGLAGSGEPVRIVPAGLSFTDKSAFRSSVLLVFGEPFVVEPPEVSERGTPPPALVRALTNRVREAIDEVTLQADQDEALALAAWVEELLDEPKGDGEEAPLELEFGLRRRLLGAYAALKEARPKEISRLVTRVVRYESLASAVGVDPKAIDPNRMTPIGLARTTGTTALLALLLAPAAFLGFLVHFPAYTAAGFVAKRYARGDKSLLATTKVFGSLLFFPVTWIVSATLAGTRLGWVGALVTIALLPVSGWAALLLSERFERSWAALRALGLLLFKRRLYLRLVAERHAIREAIVRFAEETRLPTS
jgi:glycerol-3-phosphate O-acyltransferase / dihydroxyacetone phosphate acyltransferase